MAGSGIGLGMVLPGIRRMRNGLSLTLRRCCESTSNTLHGNARCAKLMRQFRSSSAHDGSYSLWGDQHVRDRPGYTGRNAGKGQEALYGHCDRHFAVYHGRTAKSRRGILEL